MSTGPCQDTHQFDGRSEICLEPYCRRLYLKSGSEIFLLRGDTDGAVVGVACAHSQATDRLERRVRNGDSVRAERQRLDEIRFGSKTTRNDERNIIGRTFIQVPARPRQHVHPGAGAPAPAQVW